MAKLVYGMNQSLDGYIAGPSGGLEAFAPDPELFRHFLDHVSGVAGMLYGTKVYQVMQYWDDDQPGWNELEHAFAAAWRSKPKWVVSQSLKAVGPNATLVSSDLEAFIRRLKADIEGEIDVAWRDSCRQSLRAGPDRRVPALFSSPGAWRRQAILRRRSPPTSSH